MLDLKSAKQFVVAAQVIEPTEQDIENVQEVITPFYVASSPGPIADGKPRMLFISAWMAHEGRNENGDAFVAAELEKRVKEGLFAPPYAGMIDDDHDFMARGFWYKTVYAFDEQAQRWGIFANGAIWAWRFPELADRLTAEQVREGKIMVSMSTVPESREFTNNYTGFEGQHTTVLHNPVFFTTSLLSIPPGDAEARGKVSEDSKKHMMEPEDMMDPDKDLDKSQLSVSEEVTMPNENVTAETTEVVETPETVAETTEVVETVTEETTPKVEAATEVAEQKNEEKTVANDEVATLTAKLAEAEVTIKSLTEAKQALEVVLADTKNKLQVYVDAEAAKLAAEKVAARLNEVPEVIKTNLEKHAEKDVVLARWATLPDNEWQIVVASLKAVDTGVSFTKRSEDSGTLPVGGNSTTDTILNLKSFLR